MYLKTVFCPTMYFPFWEVHSWAKNQYACLCFYFYNLALLGYKHIIYYLKRYLFLFNSFTYTLITFILILNFNIRFYFYFTLYQKTYINLLPYRIIQ